MNAQPPPPPTGPLAEFLRLRDAVLRHVPHDVSGGVVGVSANGIKVTKPGIALSDLSAMLADISGGDDILPEGMVLRDVRLESLSLLREPITHETSLSFVVSFAPHAPIEIAPGVAFRAAGIEGRHFGGHFTASASATITVEGYDVAARLDMPAGILRARIAPSDPAAALLADRGIVASGGNHVLRSFELSAHIPLRRVVAYVAFDHPLAVGPVKVAFAEGELALGRASRAAMLARLEIELAGHETVAIEVEAGIDGQGWQLAGGVDLPAHTATLQALTDAAVAALGASKPTLPPRLASLALRRIHVALDSHLGTFRIEAGLDWDGGGDLTVTLTGGDGALSLTGEMRLGEAVLDLVLEGGGTTMLGAVWRNGAARPLDLGAVLGGFGATGFPALPVTAKALAVASTTSGKVLATAEIDAGIDLSRLGDLPILGALMPANAEIGLRLDPYYMSDGLTPAEQGQARGILGGVGHLPATLAPGPHPVALLKLGGFSRILEDDATGAPEAAPAPPVNTSAPHGPAPGLSWTEIDRHLGPLHVQRGGYALTRADAAGKGAALSLALDAELSVAGLTLSLAGLGADYDFDTHDLTPHLTGMGLDLRRGPVEVGAAFLNVKGDFVGSLTIGMPSFALHALGAFRMIEDTPSIFAFGTLDMPLGGPVFFFVDGLSGGIGIHRSLHMPEIDRIAEFPLISAANAAAEGTPPVNPDPMFQLRLLHDYVRPELGAYFLAIGIKFNSFKLIHGNVLAIAQFGRRFEVDLVGIASYAIPPELRPGAPALASIALTVEARLDPERGTLKVDGRLDPRSYVYSPLCHLSGGFAFHAWLTGDHAGDFVLSVGGYNRHWTPPPHYPHVPRIELKFQVSPEVYLKGAAYFAMTPSVAMAGGALHAQVDIGSLHAWADLSVDFLVAWEPFHYDAWLHIGIGAKWKCFHTHASADLHVWGPAFSGEASVDWWIFSFDIEFGARDRPVPAPISFVKFKSAFLGIPEVPPAGSDAVTDAGKAILGLTVSRGQTGKIGDAIVVDPSGLELRLSTRVPADHLALDKGDPQALAGVDAIGMPPLWGASPGGSTLRVTVTHDGAPATGRFGAEPVVTAFPAALWSPRLPPTMAAAGKLTGQAVVTPDTGPVTAASGLTVTHLAQPVAGGSAFRRAGDFRYPPEVPESGFSPAFTASRLRQVTAEDVMSDLAALGLDMSGIALVGSQAIGEPA